VLTASANSINTNANAPSVTADALAGAPANVTAPLISGSAQVTQTLSASTGAWTNTPTSYTYQWFKGGVSLGAASSVNTLLLSAAHEGGVITVSVTAINGVSSTSIVSAGTAAVSSAPVSALFTFADYPDGTVLASTSAVWDSTYGTSENRYTVTGGVLRCLTGTGNYGAEVWQSGVTGNQQVAEVTVNPGDLTTGGTVVIGVHTSGAVADWMTINSTNVNCTVGGVQQFSAAHGINLATTAVKMTIKQEAGVISFVLNGVIKLTMANTASDGHPSFVFYNATGELQAGVRTFSTIATQ
jgi:hypothetical protein